MGYQAWHLAAMEEHGYMDTDDGLINRVAKHLANSPNDDFSGEEFKRACVACGVDPDSFTGSDLRKLQQKLNQTT